MTGSRVSSLEHGGKEQTKGKGWVPSRVGLPPSPRPSLFRPGPPRTHRAPDPHPDLLQPHQLPPDPGGDGAPTLLGDVDSPPAPSPARRPRRVGGRDRPGDLHPRVVLLALPPRHRVRLVLLTPLLRLRPGAGAAEREPEEVRVQVETPWTGQSGGPRCHRRPHPLSRRTTRAVRDDDRPHRLVG